MKIRPVGVELFHANTRTERGRDGRTGHIMKLIVTLSNLANSPENVGRIQLKRQGEGRKIMLKINLKEDVAVWA